MLRIDVCFGRCMILPLPIYLCRSEEVDARAAEATLASFVPCVMLQILISDHDITSLEVRTNVRRRKTHHFKGGLVVTYLIRSNYNQSGLQKSSIEIVRSSQREITD